MRSALLVGVLALARSAFSQEQYYIDPDSVSMSLRQFWCQQQQTQCPLICLQYPGNSASTQHNDCDPKDLSYSCVCASGQTPNITEYSQTVPFFICQEWGTQCAANCGQNPTCQADCTQNHPCGAQSPAPPNSSVLTATPSASGAAATNAATTTGGGQYSGFGGAAATTTASTTKKGAAMAAVDVGKSYGLAVVFAGLFAGFAVLL